MNEHYHELSDEELAYRKKRNKEEMKYQIISFMLMIALTGVAFAIVAGKTIEALYFMPFLILLAVVQVVLQLFYLMHMKEEGYGAIQVFMLAGTFVALIVAATFIIEVWI